MIESICKLIKAIKFQPHLAADKLGSQLPQAIIFKKGEFENSFECLTVTELPTNWEGEG